MTLIKVILVGAFLGAIVLIFRNRGRVGIRAGARLMALLIAAAAIASIIEPSITQRAASLVGVTRGTDLVLYLFIVAFVIVSAGSYFRFRELERRFVDLVRASAIQNAVTRQGMPGGTRKNSEPTEPA